MRFNIEKEIFSSLLNYGLMAKSNPKKLSLKLPHIDLNPQYMEWFNILTEATREKKKWNFLSLHDLCAVPALLTKIFREMSCLSKSWWSRYPEINFQNLPFSRLPFYIFVLDSFNLFFFHFVLLWSKVITCWQRDVLMCVHENGGVSVRTRRRNNAVTTPASQGHGAFGNICKRCKGFWNF